MHHRESFDVELLLKSIAAAQLTSVNFNTLICIYFGDEFLKIVISSCAFLAMLICE
jgi:hypothetical protein